MRRDGWFDGYQEKRDSARQLNDTYARIYPIDYGASMERLDEALLMLKPAVMQSNLRSFLKSLGKMELKIGCPPVPWAAICMRITTRKIRSTAHRVKRYS